MVAIPTRALRPVLSPSQRANLRPMRSVKILATVGPASREPAMLDALLAAGVDGFRVNFSHGLADDHRTVVARIREAARRAGRHVAVLGDLSGPKIRCGTFAAGKVELVEGQGFTLTTRPVPGDATAVSTTYPLANDLQVGDTVLLDDGLLRFRVKAVAGEDVVCTVEVGGELSDRKGINVPGARLSVPALTPKDEDDLRFGLRGHDDQLSGSECSRAAQAGAFRGRGLRRRQGGSGVELFHRGDLFPDRLRVGHARRREDY